MGKSYEEIIASMEDDIDLYIENIFDDFKNELVKIISTAKDNNSKCITIDCTILDDLSQKIYHNNLDESFDIFFRTNDMKGSVLFNYHIKPVILDELLCMMKNSLDNKIYLIYRDLKPLPIVTITWTFVKYIKYILLYRLLGMNTPDDTKHMTSKIRIALMVLAGVILLKISFLFM